MKAPACGGAGAKHTSGHQTTRDSFFKKLACNLLIIKGDLTVFSGNPQDNTYVGVKDTIFYNLLVSK